MRDDDADRQADHDESEPSVVYERHEREVTIRDDGKAVVRDEHEQVIAPRPSDAPAAPSPSSPAQERSDHEASVSEGDSGELGDRITGPPRE